ncbi:hypothetical protein N0V85_000168 [Neurospora sp. IMI 360204]|nr:hypothetical protein N0V85_000168 [Neurospora sp. IMI 360204]
MTSSSLDRFPDELIRHILLYVSPEDNVLNIQPVSRRFYHIANEPLLWRYLCRNAFTFWRPEHYFFAKLSDPRPTTIEWKKLWLRRKGQNHLIKRLLDEILTTRYHQLKNIQRICRFGYDAKDFLLEQCHVDESHDDVLARRYYANSALDSIHRGMAVEVWSKCYETGTDPYSGLDRALGAFDLFVLHDQPQDLEYILSTLDTLAHRFMLEHPEHEIMSTRQKALALNRWLRAQNLMGMENEIVNYHNLRNCLLGHALSDDEHPSLPIISSAIFASVAERLGMSSACCAFPSHVHASVKAPPGMTLDGDVEEDPKAEPETMYLNPYKWDGEVTLDELRRALVELGWTQGSEVFLRASPVPIIILRTAANIKAATSRIQNLADRSGEPIEVEAKRLRAGHPDINVEAAKYASMWAELMVKPVSSVHWDHSLEAFLHSFAMSWGEDAWIVRKYLLPLYEQFAASQPHVRNRAGWENVREILNMLDNLDRREAVVTRRWTQEMQERVRYRIGQVFRHKRYGWIGIINGWAAGSAGLPVPHYLDGYEDEVQSPTTSPRSSGDRLHSEGLGLRPQLARVFYTCMSSKRPRIDRLRVAQNSIEIITDPNLIPESLKFLAGKYFKRFDKETCTFISNIKESYPDD